MCPPNPPVVVIAAVRTVPNWGWCGMARTRCRPTHPILVDHRRLISASHCVPSENARAQSRPPLVAAARAPHTQTPSGSNQSISNQLAPLRVQLQKPSPPPTPSSPAIISQLSHHHPLPNLRA